MDQMRLKEILDYEPSTGEFKWKASRLRSSVGSVAGTKHGGGYLAVMLDGNGYLMHRLAWLWVHGEWPKGEVDHMNGDKKDNRIENLRDVPRRINMQNLRKHRSNSSHGVMGVYKQAGKWVATVQTDKKKLYLGRFVCPLVAHIAYLEAKRRVHDGCTI